MTRESIFIKAKELIIADQVHFDFISETMGVNYICKDYPVRIYAKEGFRYLQCNCRNQIFQQSLLCKHAVATIVTEFFRLNPNLVMIDLDDPSFRFKTALEVLKAQEQD